jgi:predicted outer membrane repeat protein
VSGNSADFYGGGIYSRGPLSISSSVVSGNAAGYYGGGLYAETGSTLAAANLTLSGNSAAVGGGISNHDGTVSIEGSTIVGNSAGNAHGGSGGGIHNGGLGGSITVDDSTIAYNTASDQGGALYIELLHLHVRRNRFSRTQPFRRRVLFCLADAARRR